MNVDIGFAHGGQIGARGKDFSMWTPNRGAMGALLGSVVLVGLSGCVVYPAPYQAPYPSSVGVANNVNYTQQGQAMYAPAYPAPRPPPAYMPPDRAHADRANLPNAFPANGWSDPGYADPGYGNPGHDPAYGAQANSGYAGYSDSQGQIVDIRRIGYRGNPQASAAAGTAIGGVVGGAIGNSTGHRWNRGGNTLAGVLAGALIGSAIGTAASYQTAGVAYRVTVRMDSGAIRTVDYANPPGVRIGDRVGFDGQQFYR